MSWINFQPVYFHVINRNISAPAEKVFIQIYSYSSTFQKNGEWKCDITWFKIHWKRGKT